MRFVRFGIIGAVAALAFLLSPTGGSQATPGLGGTPVFSVSTIGPAHDISPVPAAFGMTCTSADVLTLPGAGPAGPCGARLAPAPPGPVPDAVTAAPIDSGLNLVGGPFTDDLDGLSFSEAVGVAADYDFSVGPAPANGGTTVGVACGLPPTVASEAAMLQAQGDMFTTAGAPVGCNVQFFDEAALGLIAPNPAAPGMPPLDNVDAMAEFPFFPGPCTAVGGTFATSCAAFTVTAGSAVLGAIPPSVPCLGAAADGATILVPPGSPPNPCTPAGCPPGGIPCIAVPAAFFGLVPGGDDIDALCWFDINGNLIPDTPLSTSPFGDMYMFSLTPGSASVVGLPFFSPAAILGTKGVAFAPTVIRTPASLGLMPGDNVDGLICHQLDLDADTIPGDLDNCPAVMNANQSNVDSDTMGDACDTEGPPGNSNGIGGADDCTDGVDNDGDGNTDAADTACAVSPCGGPLPPFMIPPGDSDCDGFTDGAEGTIGTDPANPCADTPLAGDELDDKWPSDFDDNTLVNITDLFNVLPPFFGTAVPPTSARRDLVPSGVINISDLVRVLPPYFGYDCG